LLSRARVFPGDRKRDAEISPGEITMPYATGETPLLGDYVKNKYDQPGTVIDLFEVGGKELVGIRWDDGGRDLPLTPAREFTLISRKPD
jgi:hypothetical protein